MKKIIIMAGTLSLLLSGCSKLDPYMEKVQPLIEKIPFLGGEKSLEEPPLEDESSKEEENSAEEAGKEGKEGKEEIQNDPLSLEAAYFNDVKVVDGRNIIQNPENVMALVNKQFSLPDGYEPSKLMIPDVAFSYGKLDLEKSYLRQDAAQALEKLFTGALNEGVELFAVSGYRSFTRQSQVFEAEVSKVGKEKAVQAVAIPGSSEHQTGLSMDISSRSANLELSEEFGETREGKWLAENAHRYGFILRYPKGKEGITGYKYEPWHFRYVGTEAATVIYEKKWTLEEYFDIVKKI
ncbi:D-alanyl-D-alanine carboxypeptidase family protein [Cytobacillus oceanisediminis]|uniref:M15 family metallopeptidase n=1 Tax=Cytobacillus oceanisediminis TaxID=665099 RepID=UPI001864FB14|nr:M15 family metallopeptidase [Cytobacillus oceanisediminis]MBU8731602.1 D-alanyl-D-alanine carboxypeptidase family protein [Cytobacillus oceanisediminis]MCM3401694.1 M15 family metallopeptidase [Cytobacillus oceanisediminis]MDK7664752.1 M15 family metallopeptidase [Cytobacillus oceanisediminis]QOK29570.1 M15 family metallopeptidase [Cytobacillus oceanisediminis]